MNYRLDIQALRAISVLLVFFSHAGVPLFKNGFIGVDIFFVISGYVITQQLVNLRQEHGRIPIFHFYLRRFLRLAPALWLVSLVSLAAYVFFTSPINHSKQFEVLPYVLSWLTNLVFIWSEVDYFSTGLESSLFLHTWSLSVEEQFYLIWPLLITLFLKGKRLENDLRSLVFQLLFMALVFFLFSMFLSYVKPLDAYFSPLSRGYQFVVGALAFTVGSKSNAGINIFLKLISMLLLCFSLLLIDSNRGYPGWQSALPTMSAFFFLISRDIFNSGMQRWPAKLLVRMGDISYSFYLWHWPVIVLSKELNFFFSMPVIVIFIFLLLISSASYYFLERPVRYIQFQTKRGSKSLCVTIVVAFSLSCIFFMQSTSHDRLMLPTQTTILSDTNEVHRIYASGCDSWYFSSELKPCVLSRGGEKTAVLFGDSVAAQWISALEQPLISKGYKIIVLTKSACPLLDIPIFYQRINAEYVVCSEWRKLAIKYIEDLKPDLLILSSSVNYSLDRLEWTSSLRRVVYSLADSSDRLIYISPTPVLSSSLSLCVSTSLALKLSGFNVSSDVCYENYSEHFINEFITSLPLNNLGVEFIEMNDLICPKGVCYASDQKGTLKFKDDQHLTVKFLEALSIDVESRLFKSDTR